ncbi:DUF4870 domain-containing protein [Clostridium grantii]|uniref:DUF4870 domain-containing protein n=1 Tax=Clostridium grantii DSM 8605 TaxID=1121316 RepID=A0A1M5XAT4_9CLOT|nr:DUF4870 domain-containing protein [Clostridium grantii]SHH96668.1 hypothetical protein SAMN02745207_03483 [Clostridium grantii DSM 8605]
MENGLSTESKLLAIASHAALFVGGGVIVPLVIYLLISKENYYVRENAKQAFVSQGLFYISYAISGILCILLIGFLMLPILGIMQIVFTIIAIIKTWDGQVYAYPITGAWADKL